MLDPIDNDMPPAGGADQTATRASNGEGAGNSSLRACGIEGEPAGGIELTANRVPPPEVGTEAGQDDDEDAPIEMPSRIMGIDVDPVANLVPGPSRREYKILKNDVDVYGFREPCKRVKGMLIDGRARAMVSVDLGITPPIIDLPDNTDVAAYVMSANAHRRHLNKSQLAVVVVAAHEWVKSGFNQHSGGGALGASPATSQAMADLAGVSKTMIQQAKLVHEAGLDAKVLSGEQSLKDAAAEATKILQNMKAAEDWGVEPNHEGASRKGREASTTKRAPRAKLPAEVIELQRLVRQHEDEIHDLDDALEHEKAEVISLKAKCRALEAENARLKSQTALPVRETAEVLPADGIPFAPPTGQNPKIQPKETFENWPGDSKLVKQEVTGD